MQQLNATDHARPKSCAGVWTIFWTLGYVCFLKKNDDIEYFEHALRISDIAKLTTQSIFDTAPVSGVFTMFFTH